MMEKDSLEVMLEDLISILESEIENDSQYPVDNHKVFNSEVHKGTEDIEDVPIQEDKAGRIWLDDKGKPVKGKTADDYEKEISDLKKKLEEKDKKLAEKDNELEKFKEKKVENVVKKLFQKTKETKRSSEAELALAIRKILDEDGTDGIVGNKKKEKSPIEKITDLANAKSRELEAKGYFENSLSRSKKIKNEDDYIVTSDEFMNKKRFTQNDQKNIKDKNNIYN